MKRLTILLVLFLAGSAWAANPYYGYKGSNLAYDDGLNNKMIGIKFTATSNQVVDSIEGYAICADAEATCAAKFVLYKRRWDDQHWYLVGQSAATTITTGSWLQEALTTTVNLYTDSIYWALIWGEASSGVLCGATTKTLFDASTGATMLEKAIAYVIGVPPDSITSGIVVSANYTPMVNLVYHEVSSTNLSIYRRRIVLGAQQ